MKEIFEDSFCVIDKMIVRSLGIAYMCAAVKCSTLWAELPEWLDFLSVRELYQQPISTDGSNSASFVKRKFQVYTEAILTK